MAIARGIRRFDGRSAFSTWSYRVATNACLDELRRRRRRPVPRSVGVATDGADERHAWRELPARLDGDIGATTGDRLIWWHSDHVPTECVESLRPLLKSIAMSEDEISSWSIP